MADKKSKVDKRSAQEGTDNFGAEELRSSTEEYQSINEQLQSAYEELETSKEELRSVNEELQTVNSELAHRVRDLARANSDLRNLLESTQIATIFLDNDLRVRGFTPAATEVFHLLETDVGSHIDHLASRLAYPQLVEDLRKVLIKLGTAERELTSQDGHSHYIARVHPYRSGDDFIAGAVLTFLDVSSTVRAESALRESEAQLRVLLAELQHRVRNTLAIVKSITQRTAESSTSVDEMTSHLVGRLDAFSRVQSMVTRNPDAGISLIALIEDEMRAHAMREGEQYAMSGEDVRLHTRAAEALSLAIHELATNAVKHGPLGAGEGNLKISWRFEGNGLPQRLEFEWEEDGGQPLAARPTREGFGTGLLLRTLPYQLSAQSEFEFLPHGLRFSISIPADVVLSNGAD